MAFLFSNAKSRPDGGEKCRLPQYVATLTIKIYCFFATILYNVIIKIFRKVLPVKKILKHFQQAFDIIRPKKIIDTLFMGYVVFIIIPILVLGIIFTGVFTYHLSEQTKSSAHYSMQYTEKILRGQLDSVYNASYNFMYDDGILNLENYNNYSFEQAMAVSKAETAIRRVQAQNEIIDDILLYYNNSGNVLSAVQGNYGKKALFGMEQKELYDFLIANNGKIVSVEAVSESGLNQNYIVYTKAIDKKRTTGNIFSIFVLNNELIKDAVHLVNTDNGGYVMLLDDNYNCLMHDSNSKFTYTDDIRETLKKLTEKSSGKYIKANINGQKVFLVVKNISLTKLKVCFMVNRSRYISMLWIIWVIIFFVSLFIMIMSIFVARIYSRRVYRPIRNIINIFKPEQKEYGEKSEFAFFEEKYVEIQSMQNRLTEYNDTHTRNIKEMLVYNFLKGYVDDTPGFKESVSNYGMSFDGENYGIVLIKVDRMYEMSKKIQMYHYQKFVMENVVQCLVDVYPGIKEKIYEFFDGEYIGLVICRDDKTDLSDGMSKVQQALREKLDITLSVCIDDKILTTDMLPNAYKSIYSLMGQIKLCDYGCLITSEKYKEHHRTVDLNQFENKLREFIAGQCYEELDSLIDETLNSSSVFYTEIIQIYTVVIKVLADITNEENCNMLPAENLPPADKLNDFDTIPEVVYYLKTVCKKISEGIAGAVQNKNKNYDKIMDYISKNYIYDIGLQDMAEEFGFSKSYFSRYLKEVTGKNYIELLNGYRIQKAKELIDSDANLKLFQVSELVGFVSYRTFSAAFRKFDGQSPETYRRNT